jgi:hypothetical protein
MQVFSFDDSRGTNRAALTTAANGFTALTLYSNNTQPRSVLAVNAQGLPALVLGNEAEQTGVALQVLPEGVPALALTRNGKVLWAPP